MEVRETAACGISQRQFAVEFDTQEVANIYRVFRFLKDGSGFYDEDFLEDLKSQMSYIIGSSLEEEPVDSFGESVIHWEDEGASYHLVLNEEDARRFFRIVSAVEHPGEGFDKRLNQRLIDQLMEMSPSILQNLPVINR